jgi:hypothetical protein
MLEDVRKRHRDTNRFCNAIRDFDDEQRVAAEQEEIVVLAHAVEAEHVAPNRAHNVEHALDGPRARPAVVRIPRSHAACEDTAVTADAPLLAVLHGRDAVGPRELLPVVRALGLRTLTLADDTTTPAARAYDLLGEVVDTSSWPVERVAALLAERHAAGLVTFADARLEELAGLARLLALPALSPEAARRVSSKHQQRAALARAAAGGLPSLLVEDPTAPPTLDDVSFPAVLKPEAGAGGVQTQVVGDLDELLHALEAVPQATAMVVEPLIPSTPHPTADWLGDYVSVDSVITGDRIIHLGVVDRLPAAEPFREAGGVFPSQLPSPMRRAVEEATERAIRAIGITEAATHTELKLTPEGGSVIEVNARVGGYMHVLYGRAGATSPLESGILVALGRTLPAPTPPTQAGMLRLVQPPVEARQLVEVPPVRDLMALPGIWSVQVVRRSGDPVNWRDGTYGRIMDIWLEAPDHAELLRRFEIAEAFLARTVRYSGGNGTLLPHE